MFGFVINKLKNRKWLNLCLLMGVALFIALFVCHPMFEKGAGNQILDRLFSYPNSLSSTDCESG